MFNFMKKVNKKNNIKNNVNKTSSVKAADEAYMKSVEGGILPYWEDKELMRKTGIKDLFAVDTKVNKEMSYEDACDCLERAMRMVDMAGYVSNTFSQRSRELDLSSKEAFEAHMNDVMAGKTKGVFKVHHEFYSADTIRDLFIESQTKAKIIPIERPVDLKEAMERLNSAVGSLHYIKNMTFIAIMISAQAAFAEMTGFRNEK